MLKKVVISSVILATISVFPIMAHAQMMGGGSDVMQEFSNTPVSIPSQRNLEDIQIGQTLYNKLLNHEMPCNSLADSEFEKIGTYVMNSQFGNTSDSLQANDTTKAAISDSAEKQMHVSLGKNITGCNTATKDATTNQYSTAQNGLTSLGNLGISSTIVNLVWLVGLVDLVLLGVWLWKQINPPQTPAPKTRKK